MNNNVALIVDTNSNYSDVWAPCFGRLAKYANTFKKYAFTDTPEGIPEDVTPIMYDNHLAYRDQFLSCIKQIKEKYIIYTSEDYILYDYVQQSEIEEIVRVLDRTEYSFCKFIKGPEATTHFEGNLHVINPEDPNFFAQQASLWNTRAFEKIFEAAAPGNTRMQQEPQGSSLCRELGLTGLQYYSGSPKRGLHHYDSTIYPYIATAVTKGLWNIFEYPDKMFKMFEEYGINYKVRGYR